MKKYVFTIIQVLIIAVTVTLTYWVTQEYVVFNNDFLKTNTLKPLFFLLPVIVASTITTFVCVTINRISKIILRYCMTIANAQSLTDIGQCAIYAIGADVIWSLGSDASKWTKKAIKKAFKAIAQRFLGPIGVAIAVVSFGLCVAEAALTDV